MTGSIEDPWALLRRLKLGREEFCQRLLTMLVLEAPYPRWNTLSEPSERGLHFLRRLDELSFGRPDLDDGAVFIDEFDLPSRDGLEPGCAPDYAVLTASRLWVIELKTEAASHRADQVPSYFAYAGHHHPDARIDLTYIAPPYRGPALEADGGGRFTHLTWPEVMPLAVEIWGRQPGVLGRVIEALSQTLEESDEKWQAWRTDRLDEPAAAGRALARRTSADGRQRALDHRFDSIEELEQVRVQLRDELIQDGSDSRPWVWRAATSGGEALTATGAETGYELRLSRYTEGRLD